MPNVDLEKAPDIAAAVLDVMPQPIAVRSAAGALVAVNRAWEALTGMNRNQVLGRSAAAVLPEVWGAPAGATPLAAAIELRWTRPDGKIVELSVTETSLRAADGAEGAIVTTFNDIGARKAAMIKISAEIFPLLAARHGAGITRELPVQHVGFAG